MTETVWEIGKHWIFVGDIHSHSLSLSPATIRFLKLVTRTCVMAPKGILTIIYQGKYNNTWVFVFSDFQFVHFIIFFWFVVNMLICFSFQEEDLDSQQGVIDFSLYLRSKRETCDNISVTSVDTGVSSGQVSGQDMGTNMSTVLDQKNYIEELNRHLK